MLCKTKNFAAYFLSVGWFWKNAFLYLHFLVWSDFGGAKKKFPLLSDSDNGRKIPTP
jgi:hypothetical protein